MIKQMKFYLLPSFGDSDTFFGCEQVIPLQGIPLQGVCKGNGGAPAV